MALSTYLGYVCDPPLAAPVLAAMLRRHVEKFGLDARVALVGGGIDEDSLKLLQTAGLAVKPHAQLAAYELLLGS